MKIVKVLETTANQELTDVILKVEFNPDETKKYDLIRPTVFVTYRRGLGPEVALYDEGLPVHGFCFSDAQMESLIQSAAEVIGWVKTEDFQWVQKIDEITFKVVDIKPNWDGHRIYHTLVDVTEDHDFDRLAKSYGYEHKNILEACGVPLVNQNQIVAEMIAETYPENCISCDSLEHLNEELSRLHVPVHYVHSYVRREDEEVEIFSKSDITSAIDAWMSKQEPFSKFNEEMWSKAVERIYRMVLTLADTAGIHPHTVLDSIDDDDVNSILSDIGFVDPVKGQHQNPEQEELIAHLKKLINVAKSCSATATGCVKWRVYQDEIDFLAMFLSKHYQVTEMELEAIKTS